jgi:hypothetical protein
LDFESEGREFESLRARQLHIKLRIPKPDLADPAMICFRVRNEVSLPHAIISPARACRKFERLTTPMGFRGSVGLLIWNRLNEYRPSPDRPERYRMIELSAA